METNSTNETIVSNEQITWDRYLILVATVLFFVANLALLISFFVLKSTYSNPFFTTIKFMLVSNMGLLVVIATYSIQGSIENTIVGIFEEGIGYGPIVIYNLTNSVNRFIAIVFKLDYKTWVTHKRMLIIACFNLVINFAVGIMDYLTKSEFYEYYDYPRSGLVVLTTNALFWTSVYVYRRRSRQLSIESRAEYWWEVKLMLQGTMNDVALFLVEIMYYIPDFANDHLGVYLFVYSLMPGLTPIWCLVTDGGLRSAVWGIMKNMFGGRKVAPHPGVAYVAKKL